MIAETGTERILAIVGPGDLVGELSPSTGAAFRLGHGVRDRSCASSAARRS